MQSLAIPVRTGLLIPPFGLSRLQLLQPRELFDRYKSYFVDNRIAIDSCVSAFVPTQNLL